MINGWIIFILLIALYTFILFLLNSYDLFGKLNLQMMGPILMWKTEKGKQTIEKIAKAKRFWKVYADISIIITIIAMIAIFVTLVWEAVIITQVPKGARPTPEMMIGIPGINPLIPVWYGIIALGISLIIHEFAHGILTRVAGAKIESLGLLFLIIPIGAFVEPDEEAVMKLPRRQRARMYAVGPSTNIFAAIICAFIFAWGFMGAVTPIEDGAVVFGVLEDSHVDDAGVEPLMSIVEIDGEPVKIKTFSDGNLETKYIDYDQKDYTQMVNLTVLYKGERQTLQNIRPGVVVLSVSGGRPADDAGIESGMILASIDNTPVRNHREFSEALSQTYAGQRYNFTLYVPENDTIIHTSAVLDDKYQAFEQNAPAVNSDSYKGVGYMGVSTGFLGVRVQDARTVSESLNHPFSGADNFQGAIGKGLYFIGLPFYGLAPLESPFTDIYEISGPLSFLPAPLFWFSANVFYWLFWINFMLGTTNALPARPLDGGFVFKDGLESIMKKVLRTDNVERIEASARSKKPLLLNNHLCYGLRWLRKKRSL